MNNPRLYLDVFKAAVLLKAGADQESAGEFTAPTGKQAKRAYDDSFTNQMTGETGGETPDLPERGKDWHGTVAGVPDESQDTDDDKNEEGVLKVWSVPTNPFQQEGAEKPPEENQAQQASAVKSLMESASKAFAGAPRFATGPIVPPREKSWLQTPGYSPDGIASGQVQITPRMRGEFNRWLQNTVRKSLEGLRR